MDDEEQNSLLYVFLAPVPKSEYNAWKHAQAPLPARYAITGICQGRSRHCGKYRLGPLPLTVDGSALVLIKTLPYEKRPVSGIELTFFERIMRQFWSEIIPLAHASWHVADYDFFDWQMTYPAGYQSLNTSRQDSNHLLPIGLEVLIDFNNLDPNQWQVTQVSYGLQLFPSAAALMTAWQAGGSFEMIDFAFPGELGSFEQAGPTSPGQAEAPPNHQYSQGRRFQVRGNVVQYLGWEFVISQNAVGPSFCDITYLGESIAFELALAAATALYSGRFAYPSGSQYEDAGLGLGGTFYPLLPGVDCPQSALFLNYSSINFGSTVNIAPNAICLFEQDLAIASMRHTDNYWIEGQQSTALVVRSITTLENYDYIVSISFHLDGTIETDVKLSGYLQAGRYQSVQDNEFGTQVSPQIMGMLHDHFILWKVDLDVLNATNGLTRYSAAYRRHPENPFLPPSKLQRSVVETEILSEMQALYDDNLQNPSLNVFQSLQLNDYGHRRSYALRLRTEATPQIPSVLEFFPAYSWLTHNMFVTVLKDDENEPIEYFFEQVAPDQPVVDFRTFYQNNETLLGQDLVAWVVTGGLHFPSTEDLPVTVTPGRGSGFILSPVNFFDRTAMLRLGQRIRYDRSEDLTELLLTEDSLHLQDCLQDHDQPIFLDPMTWN